MWQAALPARELIFYSGMNAITGHQKTCPGVIAIFVRNNYNPSLLFFAKILYLNQRILSSHIGMAGVLGHFAFRPDTTKKLEKRQRRFGGETSKE